jgi:hypothetical protein
MEGVILDRRAQRWLWELDKERTPFGVAVPSMEMEAETTLPPDPKLRAWWRRALKERRATRD